MLPRGRRSGIAAAALHHACCGVAVARYFHGNRGMARDYAEALKWMTWSAQKGFAPAQYALGVMYRAGTMPTSALTPPVATSLMESMEPSLRPKSPGRRQR